MSKTKLILLGVGVAAGYFFRDKLINLNGTKNPFMWAAQQGTQMAN